jgi:CubicO group peptidase (beta-lactamase class C family)
MSPASLDDAFELVVGWPVRAALAVLDANGNLAVTGPAEEPFAWASVTKIVSALAVLVAVEEGIVSIDDPAGPPGSTLRHLLAHASGLAPDDDRVLAPPGARRIYSNRGFEVALDVVADAAGMTWSDYIAEGVLAPLRLDATTVRTSPAWGGHGPLVDLINVARQLQHPTIVSPEIVALATQPAWPGIAGVLPGFGTQTHNDWGLGVEIRDHKTPHWTGARNSPETFGHFGRSGSFLWVDPAIGRACVSLADTDFGPWAVAGWPVVADAVVAASLRPSEE